MGGNPQIGWTPTAHCHHRLCTAEAQAAVWAVLLTSEREAALEDAADSAGAALERPSLPAELWLQVLEWCRVWELGR